MLHNLSHHIYIKSTCRKFNLAACRSGMSLRFNHQSVSPTENVESVGGYPEILGIVRESKHSGSRRSRLLRRQNQVPGVLYGLDDEKNVLKRMIMVDMKSIEREMRNRKSSFENTLYELKLSDDTSYQVTPRQLQVHPCKY